MIRTLINAIAFAGNIIEVQVNGVVPATKMTSTSSEAQVLTGSPGCLATAMAAQTVRTRTGSVLAVSTETPTRLWAAAAARTVLFQAETQRVPRLPAGSPARSAQVAALMGASKSLQSLLECLVPLVLHLYWIPLGLPSSLLQSRLFRTPRQALCLSQYKQMLLRSPCVHLAELVSTHRLSLECSLPIL